jgi:hypothetical protein
MRKRESAWRFPFFSGAAEESRTLDLNLGKVALYQLSYCRMFHCSGLPQDKPFKFFATDNTSSIPLLHSLRRIRQRQNSTQKYAFAKRKCVSLPFPHFPSPATTLRIIRANTAINLPIDRSVRRILEARAGVEPT